MHQARHDISRQEFQMERFIMFSDGVFAICITLLVIEIKVPDKNEYHIFNDIGLWEYLAHRALIFLGFFISFGVIGHYWTVHHRIFGYGKAYTSGLLWLNLGFLFSVVLLPFSSGILAEFGADPKMYLPYGIYVGNMCFTGFMNCWLWLYVSNPRRNLLTHKISAARIRLGLYRSLIVPSVFLVSFLLSFFFPVFSRFLPISIPIVLHWGMKGIERLADVKDKEVKNEHHESHEHNHNHEHAEHHNHDEHSEHHEQHEHTHHHGNNEHHEHRDNVG
ncbi:MAG TPA: TMEM175 family protein [Chitinophagaceae bacterium]|jgi:TMEM175 potassium channel family protein|nr:TMEM175 family protein [Chitinophagaceae bacterium]